MFIANATSINFFAPLGARLFWRVNVFDSEVALRWSAPGLLVFPSYKHFARGGELHRECKKVGLQAFALPENCY